MTSTTSRRDREDVAVRALGLAGTRWRALGTSAQVVVTAPGRLPAAWLAVRQVLDDIDVAASRFRSDSELAAVNRAAGHWVSVSPLLCRVVRVALVAAEETDGLVDPTVGASLVRLGYDRTFRLVPADAPAVSLGVADVPGWQSVDLDVSGGRVRIPPDTVIDLGATAKGYAADLAAQAAEHATDCGVLVNLGGDIAVTGEAPRGGWVVAVGDRSDPDLVDNPGPIQTVALHLGGLATSSTTARRWRRGGSTFHHIIDPRSGRSTSSRWRTVSVASASCVAANTASTAAIVADASAPQWLKARGAAARLVSTDGAVTAVGGWPTAEAAA